MKRFLVSAIFLFLSLFSVSSIFAQDIPLGPQYCGGPNNDYYVIPGEPQYGGKPCSRAPEACGNSYDDVNTTSIMPDYNACMGNGDAERAGKSCAGYVPACCYEMARTGDFTKCVGYWERMWCAKSQCDEARSEGASDSQCGDSCQCNHALGSYCGESTQPVPLGQRLGIATTPTNSPTPTTPAGVTATPTTPPGATSTPTLTPNQAPLTCDQMKKLGNYNCAVGVDSQDYDAWKSDFLAGNSTLAFFEYWRRTALP